MPFNVYNIITNLIQNYRSQIDTWFASRFTGPPFYSSVDLRNSSYKLTPIDTNLFPGGFNNLNSISQEKASLIASKMYNNKKFLIIVEDFNRNNLYVENLVALQEILNNHGNLIRYGSFHTGYTLESFSQQTLKINLIKRNGDIIYIEDNYIPEVILLNNDMIEGVPEILVGINQLVLPSIYLGWSKRTKFHYFTLYNKLVDEFIKIFPIDKFFFTTLIDECANINFKERQGMELLAEKVANMLDNIQKSYKLYNIPLEPYVVVKANQGTFGMSVMCIKDPTEILHLNKDGRKKMHVTKGNKIVDSVFIQEGVHTAEIISGNPAEIIANNISSEPIAFIYRSHSSATSFSSLNRKGANFIDYTEQLVPSAFCSLNLITKLAILAAQEEAYEVLQGIELKSGKTL